MSERYERLIDGVIGTLAEYGAERYRETFRADSCILATRISLWVLREFGVEAEPTPVVFMALNTVATEMVASDIHLPEDPLEKVAYMEARGAYGVGTDLTEKPGARRYAGHLMAYIPCRKLLIDLSYAQFSRTRYGIEIPSALFPLEDPGAFFSGRRAVYPFDWGVVGIEPHPHPPDWRNAPDWCQVTAKAPIVREIIAEARRRTRRE